jgi:DNA replicative helicase MCM subunit Mcm2 (Cdc46/Mcm family)
LSKEIEKKISDTGLDVYREQITGYLIDNPDATRELIKKALNKQYMLLYIRDKQWLEKILPKPFKDGAIFKKDYKDKDWEMKDEELLQKIKQIVRGILLEEKPRRITRTHIAHKISYYGILQRIIRNLPRTEEYLLSCCETVEEFRNRKLIYARE